MKTIPLTKGYVALVDDGDYEALSAFEWHAYVRVKKNCTTVYARRTQWDNGNGRTIQMHTQLLPDAPMVDHHDGDGLNNQRSNLRRCNSSLNQANCLSKIGTSKFKGVSWQRDANSWVAKIKKNGKSIYLGCFRDEVDAATAYNFKAFELFGEFARLNVPIEGYPA